MENEGVGGINEKEEKRVNTAKNKFCDIAEP